MKQHRMVGSWLCETELLSILVALLGVYPKAKADVLERYQQECVCGIWEVIADAIYPGGSAAIKKAPWPLSGQVKAEWAEKIGPLLDPDRNLSPSFIKLCDGLRRLVGGRPLDDGPQVVRRRLAGQFTGTDSRRRHLKAKSGKEPVRRNGPHRFCYGKRTVFGLAYGHVFGRLP